MTEPGSDKYFGKWIIVDKLIKSSGYIIGLYLLNVVKMHSIASVTESDKKRFLVL